MILRQRKCVSQWLVLISFLNVHFRYQSMLFQTDSICDTWFSVCRISKNLFSLIYMYKRQVGNKHIAHKIYEWQYNSNGTSEEQFGNKDEKQTKNRKQPVKQWKKSSWKVNPKVWIKWKMAVLHSKMDLIGPICYKKMSGHALVLNVNATSIPTWIRSMLRTNTVIGQVSVVFEQCIEDVDWL